jgi:hypothetical protein
MQEMAVRNARRVLMASALIFVAETVAVAHACLNDTQTEKTEADFRARYQGDAESAKVSSTVMSVDIWGGGAMVVGAGLAGMGMVWAVRNRSGRTGGEDVR